MEKLIPMYDFPREYQLNRDRYVAAFDRVCTAGQFAGGVFTERFEKDFAASLSTENAAAVNSGTDALELSLRALGIGAEDEVIVPSATFTATPGAVLMTGATPVFADCDPDTWEITVTQAEKLITDRTKAILGVHLYGGMFDAEAMKALCGVSGLFLIEDTAQAFGSSLHGRKAGTFGDAGCFSFYPTKNLGAFGEGGCVVSNDAKLTDRVAYFRAHCPGKNGEHPELGYNKRMDGIQAAVLSEKLRDADRFIRRKKEIAAYYLEALSSSRALVPQRVLPGSEHSYHLFVVLPEDRSAFREYMKEKGIETAVQYRIPCHRQKVFGKFAAGRELPVSDMLFSRCVSVPVYPYLTDDEVMRVADALKNYHG